MWDFDRDKVQITKASVLNYIENHPKCIIDEIFDYFLYVHNADEKYRDYDKKKSIVDQIEGNLNWLVYRKMIRKIECFYEVEE